MTHSSRVLVRSIRINRLLFVFCSALFTAELCAQTYTGVINGLIQDPSGAPVAGATVTLTSAATGEAHTETSAEDGRYTFSQLKPSTYSLRAQKAGFRDYVGSDILLNASQTREVNMSLQVGEAQ